MKCPTPCYICREICELDRLHFNTEFCDCRDGCSHGVCDDCFETCRVESSATTKPYGGGPPVDPPGKERFRNVRG